MKTFVYHSSASPFWFWLSGSASFEAAGASTFSTWLPFFTGDCLTDCDCILAGCDNSLTGDYASAGASLTCSGWSDWAWDFWFSSASSSSSWSSSFWSSASSTGSQFGTKLSATAFSSSGSASAFSPDSAFSSLFASSPSSLFSSSSEPSCPDSSTT